MFYIFRAGTGFISLFVLTIYKDLIGGDDKGQLVMIIEGKQIFSTEAVLTSAISCVAYHCWRGDPEIVAGGNALDF